MMRKEEKRSPNWASLLFLLMFDSEYREVDFAIYCPKCKDWKTEENEEPCNECLEHPTNLYTDKPTAFEAKKNGK